MSSEVEMLVERLQHLAQHDPAAQAALAKLGGWVDPNMLGLHDVMLGGWYNEEAGELAPGFAVSADDIVADIGCGDGGALNFCAKRGPHVILADLDADRVQRARNWLEGSSARQVESHVTDGNPLPLPDGAATRVICMEVLEHVDDAPAFMAELARIGAPGALYLLTVPDVTQERLQTHLAPPMYFQKPNHVRIFEREDFAQLVQDSASSSSAAAPTASSGPCGGCSSGPAASNSKAASATPSWTTGPAPGPPSSPARTAPASST